MKTWVVNVEEDENGDCYIQIDYETLDTLDWKVGDKLEWIDNHDGSWSIKKSDDN